MKPLRVGVIGTGWGLLLIEAFRRAHNVQVVAIADLDEGRRTKLAQQYKVERVLSDYHELIASDVEWVAIAAPPDMHAEMIRQAIEAGKHVLTEKPLSLDVATSRDLVAAAQAKGIVHAVDYEMRFLPGHAYAKELIDEDYIGKLLRVDVTMTMEHPWGEHGKWAIEKERGGGVLLELGAHFMDSLRWWFGEVSLVAAEQSTFYPSLRIPGSKEKGNGKSLRKAVTADDAFWCVLKFTHGGEAVVNFVTGARYEPGWSINIYGQTGTLLIKSGQLWAMSESDREMAMLPIPKRLQLASTPDDPLMWAMSELIERQADRIRGVPEALPFPDFADAVAVEELVQMIRVASTERRWVTPND